VNDLPAIVTTPVRRLEPVCWAIESETVPGPVPLEPLAIVIHDTVDDEVQEQSVFADTSTGTVVAAEPSDTLLLESVVVHELPVCVTVKPRPPMLSVPTLVKPVALAATV
jgi:hypothetical protein